jgi:hypothetical protein
MIENGQAVRVVDGNTVEVSLPSILGYERIAMDCSASLAKFIGFSPLPRRA